MIIVRQIKLNILNDDEAHLKKKISSVLKTNFDNIIDYEILKKSIDARDKNNINYVYELKVNLKNEKNIKLTNDILKYNEVKYNVTVTGNNKMKYRPVIVGSGPSGLFCGYMLSYYGYNPIIIERGEKVEDRIKSIENFWNNNKLNINSNVQFGEGGAGTFSDGKLNTLVKDFRCKKVFEIFVECGAPKEILYESKPHIGTDKLRKIIINMRNKIIKYGGEFRFNTCLTNINIDDNKIISIEVNNNEIIECDNLILALGHSARDTFKMLYDNNIHMKSKPFAIGIRIQHLQDTIDKSMYGKYSNNLPPASYKLTYKAKDSRGVYSFCMCPGGYVVNSSSENEKLVINGMSNYKRDSENANSAIVVTVDHNDYGTGIFDGMKFQEKLEKKAYKICNGKIPTQTYIDFKNNKKTTIINEINPMFKGCYELTNINEILPKYICNDLIEAIEFFNTKIEGFNSDNAILSAVESRTSSPIRIIRNEKYMSNIYGIYPIGEGAGYSGGITTSAMDGIRCFEKIISIYKNNK